MSRIPLIRTGLFVAEDGDGVYRYIDESTSHQDAESCEPFVRCRLEPFRVKLEAESISRIAAASSSHLIDDEVKKIFVSKARSFLRNLLRAFKDLIRG